MNMGGPRPDCDSCGRRKIVVLGFASFEDAHAIAILSVVKAHQSRGMDNPPSFCS